MSSRDDSLEEHIKGVHFELKDYTLYYMKQHKPLQYMINLAEFGEKMYGVPAGDSFTYGVHRSLDKYNAGNKSFAHKFYCLKYGAEEVIRYVGKHKDLYNKND